MTDDPLENLAELDGQEVRMTPRDHYSRLLATLAIATRGNPPANTWYQLAELVNASPLRLPGYDDGLPTDYEDGAVVENVIDTMLLTADDDWVDADYRFEATRCVPATGAEFCRDARFAWTAMSTTLQAVQHMGLPGGDVTVVAVGVDRSSPSGAPPEPRAASPAEGEGRASTCPVPGCERKLAFHWIGEQTQLIWGCSIHGTPR